MNPLTQNVIFLQLESVQKLHILHYYSENDYKWAILTSSPHPFQKLLRGSVITIELREIRLFDTQTFAADLITPEEVLLPDDLISRLQKYPPQYRVEGTFLSEPEGDEGVFYTLQKSGTAHIKTSTGSYQLDEASGWCEAQSASWTIPPGLVENFFFNRKWPDPPLNMWTFNSIAPEESYDYLSRGDLSLSYRNIMAKNPALSYYRSSDWSPAFYREQARLGFIAVSTIRDGQAELLPELQSSYALLDWENLIVDRSVRKITEGNRLNDEQIKLQIDSDPAQVLNHLKKMWKETSWLIPPYESLIIQLASAEERKKDDNFRIWGVSLVAGEEHSTIAGELGYSIGRTYTSLSGFFHRENRKYNNFGKLQMVLLAQKLEESGMVFWNLGHPHMPYKTALGAKVLKRKDFLERWDSSVKGDSPDLTTL